jgi:hypothetical protein
VVIGRNDGMMMPVSRTLSNGTTATFLLPSFYQRYFKLLVYRLNAIALVLKFWDKLKASDPTMTDKSWITLAQHLVYFTNVLGCLDRSVGEANMDSNWRCPDFDRVLVGEILVHRHEPIFFYAYRASRKNSDPNLSTCSLHSLGKHLSCRSHSHYDVVLCVLDLEQYFNTIGDVVSGRSNDFHLESQDLSTARAIIGPMLAFYQNSNRISIGIYHYCSYILIILI